MAIRGAQLKRAVDAIVDAFPRPSKLAQLLEYRLEKNLDALVPPGSLADRVFELLQVANSEGWDLELIEVARASNPGHRGLLAVAQDLALAPALPPQLEAVIQARNRIHDADAWYRRLGKALNRLCRIELDDAPRGTGFLVAPDLVLTNYHVVAPRHQALVARFDYRRVAGKVKQGLAVPVVAVLDHSPPNRHDFEADPRAEPSIDELDHALLRLGRPLGDEPIGEPADPGAPLRGWFAAAQPPSASFAPGAPLVIVQHPSGGPVALAYDTQSILGINASGTRVRYRTNTEPGSSGSPCFDQDWNLIALHHGGDPGRPHPGFNQGIPITAIVARLSRVAGITLPAMER